MRQNKRRRNRVWYHSKNSFGGKLKHPKINGFDKNANCREDAKTIDTKSYSIGRNYWGSGARYEWIVGVLGFLSKIIE